MLDAIPADVAAVYDGLPPDQRDVLLRLRALVLDVAEEVGAAPVQEVLRWGQPSYLSARPKESTAVRLAPTPDGHRVGVFFHCQTSVVEDLRALAGDRLTYDGTRGILLDPEAALPEPDLRLAMAHALQYHRPASKHVAAV